MPNCSASWRAFRTGGAALQVFFECLADDIGWPDALLVGLGCELMFEPVFDANVDALHGILPLLDCLTIAHLSDKSDGFIRCLRAFIHLSHLASHNAPDATPEEVSSAMLVIVTTASDDVPCRGPDSEEAHRGRCRADSPTSAR